MATSIMTAKGQITLPKEVRTALGLAVGDEVGFVEVDGGFRLVPLRQDTRDLKGRYAGRVDRPVAIEEMEEAVASSAAEPAQG